MMKLFWSPRSPFVRKVMIVLHEKDMLDQVELVRSLVAITLPPNPDVLQHNPLGKIPVLVLEDNQALVDSRVICEHLDHLSGPKLVPVNPPQRLRQLRWQALADGLTDILLLWRTELTRKTQPWQAVTDGWRTKVTHTLMLFEKEAADLRDTPLGIGQISLITALGQLDFRWPDCDWRDHFPALKQLESNWSERPSVTATTIVDDQDSGGGDLTAGQLTFS